MPNFFKKVGAGRVRCALAVAHDAGGANILKEVILATNVNWSICAAGPGANILDGTANSVLFAEINSCLKNFDVVVAATSWASDIEKEVVFKASNNGVRTIVLFDHWTNFRDRLEYNGIRLTPNHIVVCDEEAERIAVAEFPGNHVVNIENPYIQRIKRYIQKYRKPRESGRSALYVSEPIAEHVSTDCPPLGYDEFSCFEDFLSIANGKDLEVILRLHPSEKRDKYDAVIAASEIDVIVSENSTLEQDLAKADLVIGCETMAMSVAEQVGIPTYTSLNPSISKPRIPSQNIKTMRELANG